MLEILKIELFDKEGCAAVSSENNKNKHNKTDANKTCYFHNKNKAFLCVFYKSNNHLHNKWDRITEKNTRKKFI